jgi:peptidyl-prolyl cis-trans isomerase D
MAVDTVADEETLRKRYEDNKSKYGTADQRLASHILVSLPEKATPAQDAAALAKAKDLAAKAQAPGADFAALARASSDDAGSRDAGGDLGPVEKGVFGDAFDKAFFALQPGQVSAPVKLPDGYHVLWFRELVKGDAKSFEEVRPELEAEYQQDERERAYSDLAGKLIDRIDDDQGAALVPAAKEMKLPVQQTGLFSRESGEGIAALEQVRKAAFADAQKNERLVSDMVELEPNHVVILHVTDVKPSAQLPLAAVHERVLADLGADLAAKAAKARADGVLARANRGENLDAIATELGRQVSNVPGITRQAPNPQLAPLVDAAFRLGRPVPGKVEFALAKLAPEHYALVGVTAVKDGDLTGLDDATRANLRKQVAGARGTVEARAFIQGLRKQYTVKVVEDRL